MDDKNQAGKLLREAGCDKDSLKKSIMSVRGNENINSQNADGQREALKKYTLDLTERAQQGKLIQLLEEMMKLGERCKSFKEERKITPY